MTMVPSAVLYTSSKSTHVSESRLVALCTVVFDVTFPKHVPLHWGIQSGGNLATSQQQSC